MGDFGNDFSKQQADLVLSDLRRDFTYDQVLDLVRAVPPVALPGDLSLLECELHRARRDPATDLPPKPRDIDRLTDRSTPPPRSHPYGPENLKRANAVIFHGLYDVFGTGTPIDIGGFPRNSALTVDPAGAGMFSTLPDLLTFIANSLNPTGSWLAKSARSWPSRKHHQHQDLLLDDRFIARTWRCVSRCANHRRVRSVRIGTTVAVWCNRLDPGGEELLPSVEAARKAFELVSPDRSR